MRLLTCTGLGFLLAVLWFDLMFDVQASKFRTDQVPDNVRESIATYYARVTTSARPMNLAVALMMLVTLSSEIVTMIESQISLWRSLVTVILTLGAIGLAAAHTVPAAKRIGARIDGAEQHSLLIRSVLRDHRICFVTLLVVLLLQLVG
jgi:uncharacterized BrkB/YihY/UPF0761 family membrane protein